MNNAGEIIGRIAKALNRLRGIAVGDDLLKSYIGDFRDAGSFFRHDVPLVLEEGPHAAKLRRSITRPAERTPFVAMMDDVHRLLRTDLPQRLDIHLDTEALDQPTRAAMQATSETIARYRSEVRTAYAKETEGKPADTFVDYGALLMHDGVFSEAARSRVLQQQLSLTQLDQEGTPLPLLIAGQTASVPNKEGLGAALYALELSKGHVADTTSVPAGIRDYIADKLGQTVEIPRKLRAVCSFHPDTHAEFERAYASLLPDMQAAITRSGHTLQVLNLAGERNGLAQSAGASRDLLDAAGLPHYPQTLKSGTECALVMDCIAEQVPKAFRARLEQVRDAALTGKPLSPQAGALLGELHGLYKEDGNPDLHRQLKLCDDFLHSPHRAAGTPSPQPL